MTSPGAPSPRRSVRAPRPSLSATVLRMTAVALVAALLVWSALFVDVLRKRGEAAAAPPLPTGGLAGPDDGASAEAPAPVTTRTS